MMASCVGVCDYNEIFDNKQTYFRVYILVRINNLGYIEPVLSNVYGAYLVKRETG